MSLVGGMLFGVSGLLFLLSEPVYGTRQVIHTEFFLTLLRNSNNKKLKTALHVILNPTTIHKIRLNIPLKSNKIPNSLTTFNQAKGQCLWAHQPLDPKPCL